MGIYINADKLRELFQYDYRVKTRIISIELFNELVDGLIDDAENKTQGDSE